MIKIFITIIFFITINNCAFSQMQDLYKTNINLKLNSREKAEESLGFSKVLLLAFPLNPILMIEGKRFYAGITKDVSFGNYPYGRISLEYSLIFRQTYLNQVRASYNYDFGLESGDFAALILSVGGGYFTDFKMTGYFPQLSLSMLFPITDNIATLPYIKVRETFMTKGDPDIFDFSFGFGMYVSVF